MLESLKYKFLKQLGFDDKNIYRRIQLIGSDCNRNIF